MTNEQIIMAEQLQLLREGILHYTGNKLKAFNTLTQEVEEIDEIQPIHTYATWKSMGYQVKKGEKAIAKFPIWKFTNGKFTTEEVRGDVDVEQSESKGYCFMKMSAFFTNEQVEKIEEEVA